MRLFRVVLRSGATMDITAKAMRDEPESSENIYFFHDLSENDLVATVKRDQIAGVVFHLPKSGVVTATTPLPGQRR
jgi:hypothetical protein